MARVTIVDLRSTVEKTNASLAAAGVCSIPPRFTGNGSPVRLEISQTYGRTQVGVGNDSEWWWTLADGTPRHCIEVIRQWMNSDWKTWQSKPATLVSVRVSDEITLHLREGQFISVGNSTYTVSDGVVLRMVTWGDCDPSYERLVHDVWVQAKDPVERLAFASLWVTRDPVDLNVCQFM